jgi:hypothetical protein
LGSITKSRICGRFDEQKSEAFFRKWLRRLPHPFSAQERRAGYRYDLPIFQAEFSLTQIWDQAASGRCFFEEIIRENIDLGRPKQVQLIFSRKLKKPIVAEGRCRTRITNQGVIPSLHIYYKNTHSKQYHKAAKRHAGLRTETTINNAYDFGVGRRLRNPLRALRQIGLILPGPRGTPSLRCTLATSPHRYWKKFICRQRRSMASCAPQRVPHWGHAKCSRDMLESQFQALRLTKSVAVNDRRAT